MRFTIVNDADGTLRIHRSGCADIKRRMINGSWDTNAENVEALVSAEREALRSGGFGDEADDFEFVILPCARRAVH